MNSTSIQPGTGDRVWHKGPPPGIGWWNASNDRFASAWRWWGGAFWSDVAFDDYSPSKAAKSAAIQWKSHAPIEWTHYYPANARVPRPTTERRDLSKES